MYGLKKYQYASESKYAGMISLYGSVYLIITGFVLMLFGEEIPYIANATLIYLLMLLVTGFVAMFFGMVEYRRQFPSEDKLTVVIVGVILVIAVQFASQMVGGIFFSAIPFSTYSISSIPTNILFVIIFTQAPIAEEYLFSAFGQTTLVTFMKQLSGRGFELIRTALIIGVLSALFALYHGRVYASNLPALASVFVGRVIYSSTYEYTDSLDIPILLHMINNIMAIIPLLLAPILVVMI